MRSVQFLTSVCRAGERRERDAGLVQILPGRQCRPEGHPGYACGGQVGCSYVAQGVEVYLQAWRSWCSSRKQDAGQGLIVPSG
jgi:hypothetical protein